MNTKIRWIIYTLNKKELVLAPLRSDTDRNVMCLHRRSSVTVVMHSVSFGSLPRSHCNREPHVEDLSLYYQIEINEQFPNITWKYVFNSQNPSKLSFTHNPMCKNKTSES